MSKHISNKKGRSRKTPARSGVRYGWRKRAAMRAAYEYRGKQMAFEAALRLQGVEA